MLNDISNLLKNLNLNEVKGTMSHLQAKLKTLRIEEEVGAGMVKATLDGTRKVVAISIDNTLLNPSEKDTLQDLIVAAINRASETVEKRVQELVAEEALSSLSNLNPTT